MPWGWSWPFLPNTPVSFQKLCVCEICNSQRTFRSGTCKIRFYFSTTLRNFKFKVFTLPNLSSRLFSVSQPLPAIFILYFSFYNSLVAVLEPKYYCKFFSPLHISVFYLRSLWYESVPPHHQSLYDLSFSFTQRAYMNKNVRYLTKQSIIKYSPTSQCN